MAVSSDEELWEAFELHQSVGVECAGRAWDRVFESPIGNYLWFVAELAHWGKNHQHEAQLLCEWHASYAASQEGYIGEMHVVYTALRSRDIARFQCDNEEIHEELLGVSHALHRRWRVVGYPDDYIERQLRAVCNVLRIPFEVATPGIIEVLGQFEQPA